MLAHLSRLSTFIVLAIAVLALGLGHPTANAGGTTLVVDTTADDPTLFACTGANGDCSLRGAITNANGISTPDVIQLASNVTYLLDEIGADENTNATGDLDVLAPITLEGNGSTVDANSIDRVFDVNIPATEAVSFNDVTVTGGNEPSQDEGGGGIRMNLGQLTLSGVTVTDNTATDASGGGIYAAGDADIDINNSIVSFNTAPGFFGNGGGLYRPDGTGTLEVNGSTFDNNAVSGVGGGVYTGIADGDATIVDTDITNNTANDPCEAPFTCFSGGGGVYAGAEAVTFFNGSVSNNHAPTASGGGVYVPEIHVSGTVFSGNTAAGYAGGIFSFDEDGTIVDAIIINNQSLHAGGMFFGGELSHSTVSGNQATGNGGGVASDTHVDITHTTISGNIAGGEGGGVIVRDLEPTITNSTISGNTAASGGGIARNTSIGGDSGGPGAQPQGFGNDPGPLTITHSTIANNTAVSGANIKPLASQGDTIVRASIIADPTTGANCSGPLLSDGYNVEDQNSCGLNGFHDAVNAEPFLLALDNNGGATLTHALGIESPAIDRVLVCPPPDNDQTDDTRPKGNACDSGAFESDFTGPTAEPTQTPAPTSPPTPTATPVATATATSQPTPTATPIATPSGTPTGDQETWGDSDCSGQVGARDNQAVLRHVLSQTALSQTEPCPDLGHVLVEPPLATWGDWDCNGSIGARDNQALLRFVLGQPALSQTEPCPDIGTTVAISG